MILWRVSGIGKRVSLLGVLALSVSLLTSKPANGQAATASPPSTAAAKKAIRAVQERLHALGYQVGPSDGLLGPKTVAALKSFQASHALPVSGVIDDKTLAALTASTSKTPTVTSQLKDFEKEDPAAVIDPNIESLRLFKDSDGTIRQSGQVSFGGGGEDYSNKRILNDTGGPIGLVSITSGDREVATLFVSGKEAVFDSQGRLVYGAGYIQALPGEYFHVVCADRDGRVELELARIEWDDNGKATSIQGLNPILTQTNGPDLRIQSEVTNPTVKNGILIVITEGGTELRFKTRFGDGSQVLRLPRSR